MALLNVVVTNLFSVYSEYITNAALGRSVYFRIRGEVIRTVKYAEGLVLQDKEETVLQGLIHRLIETGRCCGMEKKVE